MSVTMKSLMVGNKIQSTCNRLARIWTSQARNLTQEQADKQFVDKPSPYTKPEQKCILCKHKIDLDYKNPRLLSQFVSSLNGRIYDKHITGLCEKQQTILEREVRKARKAMLMPVYHKHPKYNKDPQLFNVDRPQRPNPY